MPLFRAASLLLLHIADELTKLSYNTNRKNNIENLISLLKLLIIRSSWKNIQ
jgi:hypothetical protein